MLLQCLPLSPGACRQPGRLGSAARLRRRRRARGASVELYTGPLAGAAVQRWPIGRRGVAAAGEESSDRQGGLCCGGISGGLASLRLG